jgi:hypothetical protein
MRTAILWGSFALVVSSYLLLFVLARSPVTLRPARAGCLLAILLGLRLVLAGAGIAVEGAREMVGMMVMGVAAAAFASAHRAWLVRATEEELRGQIQSVCRGLFLGVLEVEAGQLQLSAPGKPVLRLRRLTPRVQLLMLPRVAGQGKVALLCSWLAKQYPGPVPRLRIILKGDTS